MDKHVGDQRLRAMLSRTNTSTARNALYGEAAECCGASIQIPNLHPVLHLVLRKPVATVSPKPEFRIGFSHAIC